MSTDIFSSTLKTLAGALDGTPFPTMTFLVENEVLTLVAVSNLGNSLEHSSFPEQIPVKSEQLEKRLKGNGEIFLSLIHI
jgi:hypothetical protein